MQQFVVGWEHGCRLALPLLRTVVFPLYAFHGKLGVDTFPVLYIAATATLAANRELTHARYALLPLTCRCSAAVDVCDLLPANFCLYANCDDLSFLFLWMPVSFLHAAASLKVQYARILAEG